MVRKYEDCTSYENDLRYWSNACGDLHKWGSCDIEEKDLPDELKTIYAERWEEDKDGHYCYLAELNNIYGIALINEYHEIFEEMPSKYNYEWAASVAETMDKEFAHSGVSILLAKELGYPIKGDCASEVVAFVPASVSKDIFDSVSKRFAEIAYGE